MTGGGGAPMMSVASVRGLAAHDGREPSGDLRNGSRTEPTEPKRSPTRPGRIEAARDPTRSGRIEPARCQERMGNLPRLPGASQTLLGPTVRLAGARQEWPWSAKFCPRPSRISEGGFWMSSGSSWTFFFRFFVIVCRIVSGTGGEVKASRINKNHYYFFERFQYLYRFPSLA